MKAEELMAGDWIIRNSDEKPMKICVDSIPNARGFSPIPITPEILEKNGFVEADEDGQCLFLEIDKHNSIEYYPKSNTILIESKTSSLCLESVKFVHELQHALRLCHIEKEIEL